MKKPATAVKPGEEDFTPSVLLNRRLLFFSVSRLVVDYVTIVANGYMWLKKFLPIVIGCVLSTVGCSFLKLCRPAYLIRSTHGNSYCLSKQSWSILYN